MTRLTADWLTWPETRAVCDMLTEGGHQAWFVGGCVRDALIGRDGGDLDLCTDARPDRVMDLAEAAGLKPIPTGIDHGTVTVVAKGHPLEVTTLRRDVATDGRHAEVAFSDSLDEDARRRDFTMNALYAAPDGNVIDPLDGLPDLEARRVRFIGAPEDRIREDYLRILRFFRFHAWFGDAGDGIDAEGLAACAALGEGIDFLSRERVGQEMLKLLAAPDPAPSLAAMEAAGILARVLPGAGAGQVTVLIHLEGEADLAPDPLRRLAALGGENVAERLRLSKKSARRLSTLADGTAIPAGPGELGYRHGAEAARDILALRSAFAVLPFDPDAAQEARFGAAQTLPIAAADLMEHHSGKALGTALAEAERRWIDSGFTLDRAALLKGTG